MHPHTHLPTQEEDEEKDVMDAFVSFELRRSLSDALDRLPEEEVKAIIEYELQNKPRMH